MPSRMPKRQKRVLSAATSTEFGRFSDEAMAEMKRQHAENLRISAATVKERAEHKAALAKQKADAEECKRKAAVEVLRCSEQLKTPSTAPSSEPLRLPTARKRPSYAMSPDMEHLRNRCARLVWRDAMCPPEVLTLGEIAETADSAGPREIDLPQRELFERAACDGLVVVALGDSYVTDGLASRWHSAAPWSEMASCLKVDQNSAGKARLVADGGLGLTLAGSGTFNVVLAPSASTPCAPYLFGEDVVYRFTRPDTGDAEDAEHKYEELDAVAGEAANAVMASKAGFGVRIHSVAIFSGVRPGRTLHYGAAYAMERADCDLYRFLKRAVSSDQVTRMAYGACDLLYDASRSGVLFADIKPGNLLVMPGGRLRLTVADSTEDYNNTPALLLYGETGFKPVVEKQGYSILECALG